MPSVQFSPLSLQARPGPKVEANLFGPAAFQRMVRHMVFGPAWLLLTNMPLFFLLLGMLKKEFDSPVSVIAALYLFRTFVWGLLLIVVFPSWLRFCMIRNVPFVAAYLSFLFVVLILSNLVTGLSQTNPDLLFLVGRCLRQLLTGAVLTFGLVMVSDHAIRSLGADPSRVPVWWPVPADLVPAGREAEPKGADLSLLNPALSGKIFSIQARNQYVEVQTTDKLHLLRMPFSAALARMPGDAGYRIHRSWWVAENLPHSLRRNGQNFEIVDSSGRVYPVSRPNLDLVRSLVDRNNPQA